MSTCQVKTCKNDHRKKEFRNVHFYRFPKEKALMLKWKEACGKENVDVKNGRICSAHFDAVAYKESSWMRPLLGYSPPQKRKLKSDAVPTLNLESSISEDLDKSAITPIAMNTILPEEQIEVSSS
ncbi:PREDICTED: uncharacterized protein LOC108750606 [Trachymyrmex septentrionalis]|uniref:uncharacterized protein LOC108750606 n=1 Tax=Trachymyrmex septentrionalis TaxID=34720 RepID=UPI00084EDF26|nr:PREDICTED: uncharacterized protein LOC108750606 [Trachymyrmex septentrionalis]